MRRVKLLLGLLVAGLGIAVAAAPSAADGITIRKVDTTAFPTVKLHVVVNGQSPDPKTINVYENRVFIPRPATEVIARDSQPTGIVLVVDTSGSMVQVGKIDQAKAAARSLIANKGSADSIAIVGFGTTASVLQGFTQDAGALNSVIDRLTPAGETALFDGIRIGAGLFSTQKDLQPNLIVISDGKDTASAAGFDEARSTVTASKALVFGLGLVGGGDYDRGPLETLSNSTGGSYVETADPLVLKDLVGKVQRNLANQYELTYTSKAKEAFDVQVAVGQLQATAVKVVPDSLVSGSAVKPKVFEPTASIGPLRDENGALIIGGFVFLTILLGTVAVGFLVVRSPSELDQALVAYTIAPGGARSTEGEEDDDGRRSALAQTDILKRAVAMTERIAQERGVLKTIERRLEQANVRLRAGEVIFFAVIAILLVAVLGFVALPPLIGVLVAVLAAWTPFVVLGFLAKRRRKKFTSGLPDMLQMLAGTLRAGYSLQQGVDAVATEISDPMAHELRRILVEAQLGRELEEALDDCAKRMESPDFEWAVMAIGIQREVGGNLAELLDTVADTMIQRDRLRRDVQALTAEGRMSAIVLGALAPGLGVVLWVLNPDYIGKLFEDVTGQIMLGVATVVALFGFWWMKKIIDIDI